MVKNIVEEDMLRCEGITLGIFLQFQDTPIPQEIISDIFLDPKHKIVFNAIKALRDAGFQSDILTVHEKICKDKLSKVVPADYIAELTIEAPSPANLAWYTNVLLTNAKRRSLAGWHLKAYESALDTSIPIEDVIFADKYTVNQKGFVGVKKAPMNTLIRSDELARKVFPEQKWVVPDMIPYGLNLIAGPPKIRKSLLTLSTLIAAGTGGRAFGSIPVEQQCVLYISLEDGQRRLQRRQSDMGLPQGSDHIYYADQWVGGAAELRSTLTEHPEIKLVAVDTLFLFSDTNKSQSHRISDVNAYGETTRATHELKKIADEFDIAIIAITHSRKGYKDDSAGMEDILGSQGQAGGVDNILVMKKSSTKDCINFYINGRDMPEGEKTYSLKWDYDTCQWLIEGTKEEVELGKTQQLIVDWLGDNGAATPSAILRGLTKEYKYSGVIGTIKNILTRMADSGKLYHKSGAYSVDPFESESGVVSCRLVSSQPDDRRQQTTAKPEKSEEGPGSGVVSCRLVSSQPDDRRQQTTAKPEKSEEGPGSGVVSCRLVSSQLDDRRQQTTADDSKKPEKNEKSASPAQLVDALFEYLSAFPMTIEEMVAYCNQHKSGFMNVPMMESFIMEMVTAGEIEKKGENRYIRRQ
ncbi:hypothetical protein FACS1894172_12650 [Spirochaetia bacterium]|nr:hypothetical protein FACS1894172_12650 [Spirochaetia bacterium]